MKQVAAAALVLAAIGLLSPLVWAKGRTVRVTIAGGDLLAPIDFHDPDALRPFNVWAGAGVTVNGRPQETGFIVEWSRGPLAAPPESTAQYEVTFHAERRDGSEEPVYSVTYAYDGDTGRGYVYLPGRGDPRAALNMRSIHRGLEGHWFHATEAWVGFANALLAGAAADLKVRHYVRGDCIDGL